VEFIFSLHKGLRLSSQYSTTYEMIDRQRNVLDVTRKKWRSGACPAESDGLAAISSLPSWQARKGPIFRNQRHPEKPVLS